MAKNGRGEMNGMRRGVTQACLALGSGQQHLPGSIHHRAIVLMGRPIWSGIYGSGVNQSTNHIHTIPVTGGKPYLVAGIGCCAAVPSRVTFARTRAVLAATSVFPTTVLSFSAFE